MLTIRFLGRRWLFVGDSLEEGGAITTPQAYRDGTVSYAHLSQNGKVERYRQLIGHREDIEVLGQAKGPKVTIESSLNVLLNPWEQKPPQVDEN